VEYAKPGQSCMRGGFLHDSCGAFVNQCDQFVAVCLPACSRVTTCGAIGQMCCAGLLCQSGAVCMGTTCVAG
ncbi:MAG TPA: hypothetical protein VN903_37465, partial [Polyangia bacterium]|nr:hypothetical protein [Polyangia bacterium]